MRLLLLAVGCAFVSLHAQPRLAADLSGSEGSDPGEIVVYDDHLYFAATASPVGRELWAYDPATGALAMAADVQPFNQGSPVYHGSYPSSLAVYDGRLFFRIDTSDQRGLWAYDAASGDAREVSPTPPGLWFAPSANQAGPAWFTEYDQRLFYIAWDETNGKGLWAYDQTTDLAAPVAPVPGEFDPAELTALDGRLYFTAEGGYRVQGLWAYDAASGETVRVAEEAFGVNQLLEDGGQLFFTARASDTQTGLWVYDPATDRARQVTQGGQPSTPIAYAGQIYVFDYSHASGPVLVGIDPATGATTVTEAALLDLYGRDVQPVVYDGRLWFPGIDDANGTELWVFDAATGQATVARDLYPGDGAWRSSGPSDLTVYGDRLYFSADDGARGRELWSYHAATDRFDRAADVEASADSRPTGLLSVGDRLAFAASASRAEPVGRELWLYADDGAQLAVDIRPGDLGSDPEPLAVIDDVLYLSADDGYAYLGGHGEELWAYDPATGDARLVADLDPDEDEDGRPRDAIAHEGALYFTAEDGTHGRELWTYDPATDAARLLADLNPGATGSRPQGTTVHEGRIYFSADDGAHGRELWVYDPSTDHLTLVRDLQPGADGSSVDWITSYAGRLYVRALVEGHIGIWSLDPDGTVDAVPLPDSVVPDPGYRHAAPLVLDGRLILPVRGTGADWDGARLAAFDAETAEITPIVSGDAPSDLTAYRGRLYFASETYEQGRELWVYDPDSETSGLVADLEPGRSDSNPHDLTVHDGTLYFGAQAGRFGDELWAFTDGRPTVVSSPAPLSALRFSAAVPNPTTGRARLVLTGATAGVVRVTVHDMLGRQVQRLFDGPLPPDAPLAVEVDGRALPAGVYVVRAVGASGTAVQTLSVVR